MNEDRVRRKDKNSHGLYGLIMNEDRLQKKDRILYGLFGLLGFYGFMAFARHDPWYLFNFCLFAFFTNFGYLKKELGYLGLLGIAGLIIAILGVTGVIKV